MTSHLQVPYTDEEILGELQKIGYFDVSDELLDLLKEDLASIFSQELMSDVTGSSGMNSSSWNESESVSKISISPVKRETSSLSKESLMPLDSQPKRNLAKNNGIRRKPSFNKENVNIERPNSSVEQRVVRRKVLRRVDGKPVITEEYKTLCYSQDPCDWNSDTTIERSGISQNGLRPVLHSSSATSHTNSANSSQLSRKSGVLLPKANMRRKKCDPVTRYHEYRKFWEAFRPPGEGKHKLLRWTIKQKMLDYDFA